MDRLLRIARLWDWLPTFRAVAETEHLHRAATRLDTSPSAVSRTIRLLEEAVGAPLFRRVGRALKLTDLGRELLGATRDAMRLVDGVVSRESEAGAAPPRLRIGATTMHGVVLGSLTASALVAAKVSVVPRAMALKHADVVPAILRGDLDIGLVTQTLPLDDALALVEIGLMTSGIYCAKGHPLHHDQPVSTERISAHPFAATLHGNEEAPDGWPPTLTRVVGAWASDLHSTLTLCASGRLLAVLPDDAIGRSLEGSALRRLAVELIPPVSIAGVYRRRIGRGAGLEERFVETARSIIGRRTRARTSEPPASRKSPA